jgi:hypothetical protein
MESEMSKPHFDPEKRLHWPVIDDYQDKLISRKQAEAQLKDLGCDEWEINLYLDKDDGEDYLGEKP